MGPRGASKGTQQQIEERAAPGFFHFRLWSSVVMPFLPISTQEQYKRLILPPRRRSHQQAAVCLLHRNSNSLGRNRGKTVQVLPPLLILPPSGKQPHVQLRGGRDKKLSIMCFFVFWQDELVMSSLKVGSFLQILRSPEFFPSFIGILDCVVYILSQHFSEYFCNIFFQSIDVHMICARVCILCI